LVVRGEDGIKLKGIITLLEIQYVVDGDVREQVVLLSSYSNLIRRC